MNRLSEIFDHKREEVEALRHLVPLEEMKQKALDAEPTRGFRNALAKSAQRPALIAEVKKASPSQGVIRPDFDPVEIALSYQRVGAHCLSVLTEERYFQGSVENLIKSREVTHLPVLRKDFIYDEYQVYESRAMGADAILLIVASLEQNIAEDLQSLAWGLSMDVLVEVHSADEVKVANDIGANLIGVNNRNLATFQTDLAISTELLPLIRDRAIKVSESALSTRKDIEKVRQAGADAVLIGTTFCASPDIELKVREVMGW